jgi:hypothetical protein
LVDGNVLDLWTPAPHASKVKAISQKLLVMNFRTIGAVAAALTLLAPVAGRAALSVYSQNFEGLNAADPSALQNDGWLVYADVYSADGTTWQYGYGAYPAPTGSTGFSGIGLGFGGPGQGGQQLVVYSDYNNGSAHSQGQVIQANVFQLQTIGALDTGSTWKLDFDARLGNLQAPSTAQAFILSLDPANGYALTGFVAIDTSAISASWNHYAITLPVTASAGNILEFGFANRATHYQLSGVVYDNISFAPVPEPSIPSLMLAGLALFGVAFRRLRK